MMTYSNTRIPLGLLLGILFLAQPFCASGAAVKTYLKQYSIYTFESQDYLCEPYLVEKDDWLYKIFRQKGEISSADFPKFLRIFTQLNPKLNNIDAILPGHQILIPLRQISRKSFDEKEEGIVEVPVLEFSTDPGEEKVARFISRHTVQRGDTISSLLDRAFLKKGGAVSGTGEQVLKQLNPEIKDINKIYLGSRVLIPDPAILTQPWFKDFLAMGRTNLSETLAPAQPAAARPTLPPMATEDLVRLKRYTQLVQGALQHQGTLVFPGKNGAPPQTLDLSITPVLTGKDGQKTLILPSETTREDLSPDLVAGMKAYWKELRIQQINAALAAIPSLASKPTDLNQVPKNPRDVIENVLDATSHALHAPTPISIRVGNLDYTLSLSRISHPSRPDVLVNPGSVYGSGLAALEAKGNEVITLTPGMTYGEILLLVFSKLGYTTWKNPAFNADGRVMPLKGILATREEEKIFITRTIPAAGAVDFLTAEGIYTIVLKGDAQ